MLKRPQYLDVKEHLRVLHRQVMPIFFLLCAIAMILVIALRAGKEGTKLPEDGAVSRLGLLKAVADAVYDPGFDVLSPVELVLTPKATVFDPPRGPLEAQASSAGKSAFAVADGRVIFAGQATEGQAVILAHERKEGIVETVYSGLASVRVGVGIQVRRGEVLGTVPDEGELRFEVRTSPVLAAEGVHGGTETVPDEWRGRSPDRLSRPPRGKPIEPEALKLEGVGPTAKP